MSLSKAVESFFEAYRRKDSDTIPGCFSDHGRINYLQAGLDELARDKGMAIWPGLMNVFPDLTNEITALYSGDDGRVRHDRGDDFGHAGQKQVRHSERGATIHTAAWFCDAKQDHADLMAVREVTG